MPASHDDDDFRVAQRKMRDGLALVIRRKLRHMRRGSAQPRSLRLPKEGRMLKSLLAEAEGRRSRAAGRNGGSGGAIALRNEPSRPKECASA